MKRNPGFGKAILSIAVVVALAQFVFSLPGPQAGQGQQQAAAGQTTAQPLSFEVASIKPSEADGHNVRIQMAPGGRYTASGVTLKLLIQQAFDVKDFQILGGPAWMSSAAFDIVAKSDDPNVKGEQVREMLRSLLAERFKLKFHKETRELPIYALLVGKNGHKMKVSENQPPVETPPPNVSKPISHQAAGAGGGVGGGTKDVGAIARGRGSMMMMGRGRIEAQMAPMSAIVNMLAQQLGRPVIDKTDLKDSYDIKLEWTPDENMAHRALGGGGGSEAVPAGDSSGPSIFTALQEQLGLRLEAQKGPVEALVIDFAEKPSGN